MLKAILLFVGLVTGLSLNETYGPGGMPGGVISIALGWPLSTVVCWFIVAGGLARLGFPIFALKVSQVVWDAGMWSTPVVVVGAVLLGEKLAWVTALGVLAVAAWRAPTAWRRWSDGRQGVHGTATFSGGKEANAAGRLAPEGQPFAAFALGRIGDPPRGTNGRLWHLGHVLTCAPTGAGKGVSVAIPNLLTYPGSAFVLDFKGELTAVTARARAAMGHKVCLIDPFRVTGYRGQSVNWLDAIDLKDPAAISTAASLAEMLVVPGQSEDSHWDDTARDLLRGLMLYVATLPDEQRHMGEVRRLLTLPFEAEGGRESLIGHLDKMSASTQAFGVIARAANSFLGKADKERSGVLSTAQRNTALLDDPRIVEALARSEFSLADLKKQPTTVYVCLPPHAVAQNTRFLRGCIGVALAGITSSEAQPDLPVVFMLDEFAQLGRMASVEDAIAIVRGYGAFFWLFVQDLSQLKAVYPKWQTFLANAAQQYFRVADYDTARYVSDQLGQRTVKFGTQSSGLQKGSALPNITTAENFTGRALLTPDEVMATGATLVFLAGERPYALQALNYLGDPEYRGLADTNPRYQKAG